MLLQIKIFGKGDGAGRQINTEIGEGQVAGSADSVIALDSSLSCVSRNEHEPWASDQIRKIAGYACAGNAGNVFPATDFKGNR